MPWASRLVNDEFQLSCDRVQNAGGYKQKGPLVERPFLL
jgi:hypothetical protein